MWRLLISPRVRQKIANERQLFFARDGVFLGKFLGLNFQTSVLSQQIQLALHFFRRNERVKRTQRELNILLLRHRR